MQNEFNINEYMHGYCHFFALETAKKYNGKVFLWLDYDENLETNYLCHAYTEILPGIFVDALGTFTDITEREEEFHFNKMEIVSGTIEEIYEILDALKVAYREPRLTENVKHFLENNIITFEIKENLKLYDVGFCYAHKDKISILKKKENTFIKEPIVVNKDDFINNITKHKGFEKI